MTFYVTPFGRRMRHNMERWNRDGEMDTMENALYFPVDVLARKDDFVLTALLPGVKADDLDIQIVNETVSIQGKMVDARDEKEGYLLQERPFGNFSRVLTLPAQLDSAGAEAGLEDGVLTLRIPKAEAARPKSIKVNLHNN